MLFLLNEIPSPRGCPAEFPTNLGVGALLGIPYTVMAYIRDFQHEFPLSPS